jgi:hypothetical protein
MAVDLNMAAARQIAEHLGPPPPLPESLQDPEKRAEVVQRVNGELVWFADLVIGDVQVPAEGTAGKRLRLHLADRAAGVASKVLRLAELTRDLIPDVPDPVGSVNLVLRIWSGCLSAAKTIAEDTLSGPNTPETREHAFETTSTQSPRLTLSTPLALKPPQRSSGVRGSPTSSTGCLRTLLRSALRQRVILLGNSQSHSQTTRPDGH